MEKKQGNIFRKKNPVYRILNCRPYWQKWTCNSISTLAGSFRTSCRAVSCSLWEQTLDYKDYMQFPLMTIYQCLSICFLYTCTETIDKKKWNAWVKSRKDLLEPAVCQNRNIFPEAGFWSDLICQAGFWTLLVCSGSLSIWIHDTGSCGSQVSYLWVKEDYVEAGT